MAKKLFKWLGGKSWLSAKLTAEISLAMNNPKQPISTYVEPFVGGLGSFLPIYELIKNDKNIKRIVINDLNPAIYSIYTYFQKTSGDLVIKISALENKFNLTLPVNALPASDKDGIKVVLANANNFYFDIRSKYNAKKLKNEFDIDFVSYFLFLQFHAFNGIYRENGSGGHNVPFNWAQKPVNLKEKITSIQEYHTILSDPRIEIFNMDAIKLLKTIKNKDDTLIYLDPPYINLDTSENKYTQDGFGYDEQISLVNLAKTFGYGLYSNHEHPDIEKLFIDAKIEKIKRKNIVSASAKSREEDKIELLITWTKGVN